MEEKIDNIYRTCNGCRQRLPISKFIVNEINGCLKEECETCRLQKKKNRYHLSKNFYRTDKTRYINYFASNSMIKPFNSNLGGVEDF